MSTQKIRISKVHWLHQMSRRALRAESHHLQPRRDETPDRRVISNGTEVDAAEDDVVSQHCCCLGVLTPPIDCEYTASAINIADLVCDVASQLLGFIG